jgi:short-subunit dehydrogenase
MRKSGKLEFLLETNLLSAYDLSRKLVPRMIEKKYGYIFNVCSVAGIQAYKNGGSYSISKFALIGFNKALREELKDKNIAVTALIPGATYTNSWNGTELPETRFMKAEDIAEMVKACISISPNSVVEEIIMRPMLGDL